VDLEMNFSNLLISMNKAGFLNGVMVRVLNPLNPKYVKLSKFIHLFLRFLIFRRAKRSIQLDGFPIAVYDLRVNATTFDFCFFLYEAECYFRSKGFPEFDILIVPLFTHSAWEYESGYSSVIGEPKKSRRVFNLLLPLAELYGACRRVMLLEDKSIVTEVLRSRMEVYPLGHDGLYLGRVDYKKIYNFESKDTLFTGFQAQADDLTQVNEWLSLNNVKQPFVTFTLRTYGFQSVRNSNTCLVNSLATYLKHEGFDVVLVPATDDLSGSNSFNIGPFFLPGSFNIFQRNALYEIAFTNFFSSNGTHALSVLNLKSSFIFSKIVNDYWKIEDLEARGFKYGSQPWAKGRGVWIWEEETFESVTAAFEKIRVLKGS